MKAWQARRLGRCHRRSTCLFFPHKNAILTRAVIYMNKSWLTCSQYLDLAKEWRARRPCQCYRGYRSSTCLFSPSKSLLTLLSSDKEVEADMAALFTRPRPGGVAGLSSMPALYMSIFLAQNTTLTVSSRDKANMAAMLAGLRSGTGAAGPSSKPMPST